LTHEIEKCLAFADKFAVLHKGQIVFDGSATQALECDLEQWNIKNPLNAYKQLSDLVW
jgi:biotin transport system ATP-binding protein